MSEGYDPKCYELAKYFLEDDQYLNTPDNLEDLANSIQDAVEHTIAGMRP